MRYRRPRPESTKPIRGLRSAHLVALVAVLMLAACAEEGAGPQFANDPAPTRLPTVAPAIGTPLTEPTFAPAATPASVSDLLATRGAPSRVFTTSNNAIWSVTSTGEATRVFEAPVGSRIVAIASPPGGQQVAVLLRSTSETQGQLDVVILDSAGATVEQVSDVGAVLATPTPGNDGPIADTIDWSPQGDRVLVSFQNGAIVGLPVGQGGTPAVIAARGEVGSVVSPAWSPTGESIAYIASSDDGRTRTLELIDVRDGSVEEVVAPADGRFVVDFAWMPHGVSLLFTEGGELGGAVTGIDLWQVGSDGDNRELVVSAGTVAPVARITNVSPSPDGRSVAYSVLVPGEFTPLVDSVWIRDLESRLGFRIPLPSVASVDELSWTDRGVAISVTTKGTTPGRPPTHALLQVSHDGSVAALWAAPVSTGTPVSGTPAATPASP